MWICLMSHLLLVFMYLTLSLSFCHVVPFAGFLVLVSFGSWLFVVLFLYAFDVGVRFSFVSLLFETFGVFVGCFWACLLAICLHVWFVFLFLLFDRLPAFWLSFPICNLLLVFDSVLFMLSLGFSLSIVASAFLGILVWFFMPVGCWPFLVVFVNVLLMFWLFFLFLSFVLLLCAFCWVLGFLRLLVLSCVFVNFMFFCLFC